MANNNTGGCAGGILHIFGGIGMLFLTCARMGDDVLRCGSAASKFDDIGRTGSRVYYPLDDAALSSTYTKYADDAFAARTHNVIEESSSLIHADEAIPTVTAKRPILAKEGDYDYTFLRTANALKDVPKVIGEETQVIEASVEEERNLSAEDKILKMHQRLLQKFCDAYMLQNEHFNREDKETIVKGINKAGNSEFLVMKDVLMQIDRNVLELKKLFPKTKGYATAYKHTVVNNFMQYLNLPEGKAFNLLNLPLANRDAGFAIFVGLTGDEQKKKKIISTMMRRH
jgi:hypothetical protein